MEFCCWCKIGTLVSMNDRVQDVNKVTGVVKYQPDARTQVLHVPKYCSSHDKYVIVQDDRADNSQPLDGTIKYAPYRQIKLMIPLTFLVVACHATYPIVALSGCIEHEST